MGSVSVSSCRCCMFVSCVHPVAVLNSAFCMTCGPSASLSHHLASSFVTPAGYVHKSMDDNVVPMWVQVNR